MEDKIEVGEYVRTDKGIIGKIFDTDICEFCEETIYIVDYNFKGYIFHLNNIAKHSKNIIDLIEVGDFVNGFPLLEPIYNGNTWQGIDEGYEMFKRSFGEIKSIVTKEQFSQIEYKVEE